MRRPVKTIAMDDAIEVLDRDLPQLEWEQDRHWLWIVSDLAPHHKCSCKQCEERAAARKALVNLGFMYAKAGHTCPSGRISRWGNHCERPTRFNRRKSSDPKPPKPQQQTPTPAELLNDDALLALIGAL